FVFGYLSVVLFWIAKLVLLVFFLFVIIDYIVLYSKTGITAERILPERFSNGDENQVSINLTNRYSFKTDIRIIDELPVQFQRRDFELNTKLKPGEQQTTNYTLRPVERGEYTFNDLNIFASTALGFVIRRYKINAQHTVKVYPSFLSLRKFDLVASSNNLMEAGSRKIRKIGQSVEFEQIREYVTGDDIRTLNWKATARKGGQLMVNSYTDERSQQIYCVIDKGRVMKMPFNGMTLLDYAINSTLILSRVALLRQDKAGLLTFGDTIGQVLPADRRAGQMNNILETLYDQRTNFKESDFEKLYAQIRTRITQRSLIVLFTNFESLSGLQRQLPYIRAIARTHLVLVVFFENTGLKELISAEVNDIETLYIRT
ncbi:MAG: DUF58 domain-containing protein, partial [Chitinophagaceae bacterium]|nr:DUF58 domain-containing protein [Chitinophagaceae bacterium]